MENFHLQFEIVEVRFSHLGGTRNGTSGARIKKFQKTDPPNPSKTNMTTTTIQLTGQEALCHRTTIPRRKMKVIDELI